MNEEYLHRGRQEDNGEWITGNNPDYSDGTIDGIKVIPKTIGMCTNLPDKNGRLIWENDIAKYYCKHIGKVIYESGCCSLRYKYKNDVHKIAIIEKYDDYKHMEIIGNTYDNPELLEVEK